MSSGPRTRLPGAQIADLAAADYHDDTTGDTPTLSASIAHILCTSSPAHARAAHPKLNPDYRRVEEEKFDVGTAAHALILQGQTIVEIVEADDWRTKAAKEQRDAARLAGRIPLLAKHWQAVEQMADAVKAQLAALDVAPAMFTDGQPERTLIWQDERFGVHCRARLDWLRDDHAAIDDLKTTSRSANPEGWTRTLYSIGADIQAAFYLRGLEALTGVQPGPEAFRFCVVETAAPFALAVVSLAPDALALANKKVDYALERWARCLRNESWPAYDGRVHFAELPPWEEARWLERELREAA